ncbi:hypothetical protein HK100_011216 [Physocladia obscura]|uniref:XPA C-terminal domain-containing protein n=1 Tax=Physocladia obscura TaxID=109957 RepID=A0AAD5XIG3_9FUNG|nr:hypothetical protein HK100_011216 [Physocladia obscura]
MSNDDNDAARREAIARIAATASRKIPHTALNSSIPMNTVPVTNANTNSNPNSMKRKGINLDYCEFNLATMNDSRGGFLLEENSAGSSLANTNTTAVDHHQAYHDAQATLFPVDAVCCECESMDLCRDLYSHYKVLVCRRCKDTLKNKYSLLTKTECRDDYLLTDSELKDASKLPCWSKKNPHKDTYANMLLYLRLHVERFAIEKWGSLDALDAEFERRELEKTVRKRKKFELKLSELRKKTILANSILKRPSKASTIHEHKYGEKVDTGDGFTFEQTCGICGIVSSFEEF